MKKGNYFIILIIAMSIIACNKNDVASINSKSKDKGKSSTIKIADIDQEISYSFYIFQSRTDNYLEANDTSYNFNGSINHYNYAYFPTDAGTVIINQTTLSKAAALSSPGSYYSLSSSMSLNGAFFPVTTSGNQYVPAISDSVKSPVNFAYITSPSNGSVISDNNDLAIEWDLVNLSGMNVVIEIAAKINDTTKTNYAIYYTTDNGSYTLSSSFLQGFAKGMIEINLMRGYYTINPSSNGKYYGIAAYTQHTITCKLTD